MLVPPRKVIVTGDVIIEWRLARAKVGERNNQALLDPRTYIQESREPSGAIALEKLIDAALAGVPGRPVVLGRDLGDFDKYPIRGPFWNSYVMCAQFSAGKDAAENDGRGAWRVEKKLGLDRMDPHAYKEAEEKIPGDDGNASLVVVELAMQGFEEEHAPWPLALTAPTGNPWLLVRWSRPQMYTQTKAWTRMLRNFSDRIVIVTSADHLRFYGMRISRGLSWEQTVEDLWQHIKNAWADSLTGCRHFIVSFPPSGAVIFTMGDKLTAELVYNPAEIEGSWAENYDGEMMGYTRCVTAGVALELLGPQRRSKLEGWGIIAGMAASRHLLDHGFLPDAEVGRPDTSLPLALRFPTAAIGKTLAEAMSYCERARLQITGAETQSQTEDSSRGARDAKKFQTENVSEPLPHWRISDRRLPLREDMLQRGRDIVEYGSEDIAWNFPTYNIGKLFVTSREEIENLRTVRALILDYMSSPAIAKPLSVAVFGPPGSGKSFAIKELARDLASARRGPKLENVTFNISQFVGPESIAGAFHRVRDIGLSGKLPLVFWDEFDTKREGAHGALGWLQHFLAPMQDGQFQDKSMVHNVGRAIFVFAGGTKSTMALFLEHAQRSPAAPGEISLVGDEYNIDDYFDDDGVDPNDEIDKFKEKARDAKVPDFFSRLQGFVNIPSLNYRRREADDDVPRLDAPVVLRRAHLLRTFLLESPGDLKRVVQSGDAVREHLNADVGLVNAFLSVSRFKFGARSLEAIVKMSVLAGKKMYDRSGLPPFHQLSLHVDADEFLKEVDRHKGAQPRP